MHESCGIIHCDLHQGNWLIRENDDVVLGDFGCSNIIGVNGIEAVGTPAHYAWWNFMAPECDMINKESWETAKTKEEFTFNSEMWQLGHTFRQMCNGGEWDLDSNTHTYGLDIVNLIK
jgi:serine/threonine protein kinase